jgi:ribosomal protein S18 acetylase RimI-like enzyme
MNDENFIIRDYKPGDFNAVSRLWDDTGMGSPARGDDDKAIERTLSIGGKFLVMDDTKTGELIATSWMSTDGRRLYLHHFGVSPNYQGKGFSKPLLEKSLDFARSTGLQIKLEVQKNNIKAINLYEKYGFGYLGDYNVYIVRDYSKLKKW